MIFTINLAVLAGIVFGSWPDLAFSLALENSPLAWQQSSLLIASATVASLIATATSTNYRDQGIWIITAGLLVLAALDERFMGHERIQEFLFFECLGGNPVWQTWTDGITVAYGIAGLAILTKLWKTLCPEARKLCIVGLLIGLAAIALDVAFDSIAIQMIEESLEVLAETSFLCGLFREVDKRVSRPN